MFVFLCVKKLYWKSWWDVKIEHQEVTTVLIVKFSREVVRIILLSIKYARTTLIIIVITKELTYKQNTEYSLPVSRKHTSSKATIFGDLFWLQEAASNDNYPFPFRIVHF